MFSSNRSWLPLAAAVAAGTVVFGACSTDSGTGTDSAVQDAAEAITQPQIRIQLTSSDTLTIQQVAMSGMGQWLTSDGYGRPAPGDTVKSGSVLSFGTGADGEDTPYGGQVILVGEQGSVTVNWEQNAAFEVPQVTCETEMPCEVSFADREGAASTFQLKVDE